MKTKNLKNLSLNKTPISKFDVIKGGAPTTHKTNVTCGSICEKSAIICNER